MDIFAKGLESDLTRASWSQVKSFHEFSGVEKRENRQHN